MIWWIVIPAVIAAALAYAYWDHRRQSHLLVTLFGPLASQFDGRIKPATVLALPQLHFQRGERCYRIGAMASGGTLVSGTANRPGFNGPFTFVNLELPHNTGHEMRVQRSDRIGRGARRAADALAGNAGQNTGDDAFDRGFSVKFEDRAFACRVLDSTLRGKLLGSSQQRLEVALAGAKISVHVDGYVKSSDALDEMIDIATTLADNCSGS